MVVSVRRRWRLLLAGAWSLVACSRDNPAYESDGTSSPDGSSSSSGSGSASVGAPSGSADVGVGSGLGSGADSSSGGEPVCGNGLLEDGEDCDDGNTEADQACSPDCRVPGQVEWSAALDFPMGAERFQASALHAGDLIAVGQAERETDPDPIAVIVRYDVESGAELSRGWLNEGWSRGEAHAVHPDGDRLYVSGDGAIGDMASAFVACFEVDDREQPPSECWDLPLDGSTSRALDVLPEGILVTTGTFTGAGYGLSMVNTDGELSWGWQVPTWDFLSQFEALEVHDGQPIVAGTMDYEAMLADATESPEAFEPSFLLSGTGFNADRAQALAVLGEDVILAGWFNDESTFVDAWIGRYTSDGDPRWERVEDGGSIDDDEIEGIALDGAGNVIAVGMLGNRSIPTVWKLDVSDGSEIWRESYPELGEGDGFFRSVQVDGDIFVVGEQRHAGSDSAGIVLRLAP